MSEEILQALMQLFAIIAKQDDGVEKTERDFVLLFLRQQISGSKVEEYIKLFDDKSGFNKTNSETEDEEPTKKRKLTSVNDSVKILGISKKINKTLTQKQKVIVLVRLFELVISDKKFTEQRMAIINTVAEVFNISFDDVKNIESFVFSENVESLIHSDNLLIISSNKTENSNYLSLNIDGIDGELIILQIQGTDQYFIKYTGELVLYINGLIVNGKRINIFANGSTIKLSKGKPIYYSDIISKFKKDNNSINLSFIAKNIEYKFPTGGLGLRDININEREGKLIAIMGASGAGKTTLLNVLSGMSKPSSGTIKINGIDLYESKKELDGVIGYIPQDDLLIEELTVFENLYYNAKLCFRDKNKEEIAELVNKTLKNLGLLERKDLKVGNALNKLISGGQRKRLNIALELIREPSILFVDEPTSGLSSRDSENVMDLLRELALKGKLIYVVIHQPSSDIYKMFDKVIVLDTGGYQVYYGNPIESVMYFKKLDSQINSDVGECSICGSVNSELIFNIIEARVVDEYGIYQEERKVKPTEWSEYYKQNITQENLSEIAEEPPKSLKIPRWINQIFIYLKRDFLSKISNTQYIALNLLEAPILSIILSFIIRYIADPNSSHYIYRENENIPPYIFMSLVVALFLGLTVSAEEIFRDRKILKRESFLNLSRSSYLISKIIILFFISFIQTGLFVFIGNYILGIRDMSLYYWLALFTTSAFANMLGLNISSTFNSAVTIYIIIPLVLIPQMILGGAMFSFEKLNKTVSSIDKVPLIAEFMTSRWIYEALMVHQFKNNKFEKQFFKLEQEMSVANFMQVYYIPEIKEKLQYCFENLNIKRDDIVKNVDINLSMIRNELYKQQKNNPEINNNTIQSITRDSLSSYNLFLVNDYLDKLNKNFGLQFQKTYDKKQKMIDYFTEQKGDIFNLNKDNYYNQSISDIVKKVFEQHKIIQDKDNLIQQIDLIYLNPTPSNFLDFRSHFFAPNKYFAGKYFDTYYFNIFVVWILTFVFYIFLYFDVFKKILEFRLRKKL